MFGPQYHRGHPHCPSPTQTTLGQSCPGSGFFTAGSLASLKSWEDHGHGVGTEPLAGTLLLQTHAPSARGSEHDYVSGLAQQMLSLKPRWIFLSPGNQHPPILACSGGSGHGGLGRWGCVQSAQLGSWWPAASVSVTGSARGAGGEDLWALGAACLQSSELPQRAREERSVCNVPLLPPS